MMSKMDIIKKMGIEYDYLYACLDNARHSDIDKRNSREEDCLESRLHEIYEMAKMLGIGDEFRNYIETTLGLSVGIV